MSDLVTIDIGGTHARFALASIASGGAIVLGDPVTLATSQFPSLDAAWSEFALRIGHPLPRAAAVAIAGPVTSEVVRMTNNSWEIHTERLAGQLEVDRAIVLNDFAAVAHAAARASDGEFIDLAGPQGPLPAPGTISVIGPGTGLGVAHFHRTTNGYHVQATEGGHIGFAPADAIDDTILALMRERHGRVSVERVVSGPGIVQIHAALAALENQAIGERDDVSIWRLGIDGMDALAAAAVERFCLLLGRAAGDYALAHGASGVVMAGGLGLRIRSALTGPAFIEGFCDKGRYKAIMAGMPVKLLIHPQPGLYGAAAAFATEFGL